MAEGNIPLVARIMVQHGGAGSGTGSTGMRDARRQQTAQKNIALSRQLQLQKIKELDLEDNTHKRIDCLFCGKTKTLSITKRGGFLLWHFFSASCNVRGSTEEALSLDQLKDVLSNTVDNQEEEKRMTVPE